MGHRNTGVPRLDCYAFLEGQTAESIAQSFPVLTLEQVYGAITFYLSNQPKIDNYLRREEAEFET